MWLVKYHKNQPCCSSLLAHYLRLLYAINDYGTRADFMIIFSNCSKFLVVLKICSNNSTRILARMEQFYHYYFLGDPFFGSVYIAKYHKTSLETLKPMRPWFDEGQSGFKAHYFLLFYSLYNHGNIVDFMIIF